MNRFQHHPALTSLDPEIRRIVDAACELTYHCQYEDERMEAVLKIRRAVLARFGTAAPQAIIDLHPHRDTRSRKSEMGMGWQTTRELPTDDEDRWRRFMEDDPV